MMNKFVQIEIISVTGDLVKWQEKTCFLSVRQEICARITRMH